MIPQLNYFAVHWAGTIRLTGKKFRTEREAHFDAFGMSSPEMHALRLGANKKEALRKFQDGLPDPETWANLTVYDPPAQ